MRGVWTRACTSVSAHARLCFTCFSVSVNVPFRSRRLISSVQVWAAAERPIQPSAPSDASHALDRAQRAGGAQYCGHFQRTTHYTQAVQTLHALYTSEASTLPVAPSMCTARFAPMRARLHGSSQACFSHVEPVVLRAVWHWRIGRVRARAASP